MSSKTFIKDKNNVHHPNHLSTDDVIRAITQFKGYTPPIAIKDQFNLGTIAA